MTSDFPHIIQYNTYNVPLGNQANVIILILQTRRQTLELNDLIKVICLIHDPKITPVFSDFSKFHATAENTAKLDYYRNELVWHHSLFGDS